MELKMYVGKAIHPDRGFHWHLYRADGKRLVNGVKGGHSFSRKGAEIDARRWAEFKGHAVVGEVEHDYQWRADAEWGE